MRAVKNLRVTLATLGVWTAVSAALIMLLPLERAMPLLLLGLCLVPVAVFMADRLRAAPQKTRSDAAAPRVGRDTRPASPVPVDVLTEENLRRSFGEDGVATAWAPKLEASPAPVDALERLATCLSGRGRHPTPDCGVQSTFSHPIIHQGCNSPGL